MSDIIAGVSAFFTFCGVMVALFKDELWRWMRAPVVSGSIRFDPEPGGGTDNRTKDYVRLEVLNRGKTKTEAVQVWVTDLYRIGSGASVSRVDDFIPTPLEWTHIGEKECPCIPSYDRRLCDFLVREANGFSGTMRFCIGGRTTYNYETISEAGEYGVRLSISGEGFTPVVAHVLITLPNFLQAAAAEKKIPAPFFAREHIREAKGLPLKNIVEFEASRGAHSNRVQLT